MITYRGPRSELLALARALAAGVAGAGPDLGGVVGAALTPAGVALLAKVRDAFLAKSRGGAGDDGVTWPKLSPRTLAYSRKPPGAAERGRMGLGGKRVRGLLSPAEDRKWRAVYAHTLAHLRARNVGNAEALAAARAWAVLKAAGAQTKIAALGNRPADVLRDRGRLLRSLEPGTEHSPRPAEQVFEVGGGRLAVGSAVPYAGRHQEGDPGRGLPARKLWPDGPELPPAWEEAVGEALARGYSAALARLVTTRARA